MKVMIPKMSEKDWSDAILRVERSMAAMAGIDDVDANVNARILRDRAIALAGLLVPTERNDADGVVDRVEVLAFKVAGESYAFESTWVAQVSAMMPITPIPGVPNFIVGVVGLNGGVIAVIDLRSLLALPLTELVEPAVLVVVRGEGREFAVMAESLEGVRRYPRAALGNCLPALARLDVSYLCGVAPDNTVVLDARRLLTDSKLVVDSGT